MFSETMFGLAMAIAIAVILLQWLAIMSIAKRANKHARDLHNVEAIRSELQSELHLLKATGGAPVLTDIVDSFRQRELFPGELSRPHVGFINGVWNSERAGWEYNCAGCGCTFLCTRESLPANEVACTSCGRESD